MHYFYETSKVVRLYSFRLWVVDLICKLSIVGYALGTLLWKFEYVQWEPVLGNQVFGIGLPFSPANLTEAAAMTGVRMVNARPNASYCSEDMTQYAPQVRCLTTNPPLTRNEENWCNDVSSGRKDKGFYFQNEAILDSRCSPFPGDAYSIWSNGWSVTTFEYSVGYHCSGNGTLRDFCTKDSGNASGAVYVGVELVMIYMKAEVRTSSYYGVADIPLRVKDHQGNPVRCQDTTAIKHLAQFKERGTQDMCTDDGLFEGDNVVFTVGDVLKWGGTDLDTDSGPSSDVQASTGAPRSLQAPYRIKGITLKAMLNYENLVSGHPFSQYDDIVATIRFYSIAGSEVLNKHEGHHTTTRSGYSTFSTGVRVIIQVQGMLGFFSFEVLIRSLVNFVVLLSVANMLTTMVASFMYGYKYNLMKQEVIIASKNSLTLERKVFLDAEQHVQCPLKRDARNQTIMSSWGFQVLGQFGIVSDCERAIKVIEVTQKHDDDTCVNCEMEKSEGSTKAPLPLQDGTKAPIPLRQHLDHNTVIIEM